jgi:hypothetical protein
MMLNLKLRDEFLGSQMLGTAIALRRKDNNCIFYLIAAVRIWKGGGLC